MKERPILFSAPMVRALLDGTKTQTRRVAKLNASGRVQIAGRNWHCDDPESRLACPYGQPGDRLWVREAWMPDPPIDDSWASTQWAGCSVGKIAGVPERFRHPAFCNYAASWLHGPMKWTPSIHMPRWASRILLDIVAVRVERLQDISEADALAEGVTFSYPVKPSRAERMGRDAYAELWEQINGPGSWAANPWVWVIEFRRTAP